MIMHQFRGFFGTAALALTVANAAASPPDLAPPPSRNGAVHDNATYFEFYSDGEDETPPSIVNEICNKGSDSLVFIWEKAKLSRGVWHPLSAGQCQSNWRVVKAIANDPDHDAPIFYTQAKLRQDAVVYVEATATSDTMSKTIFKTEYIDPETGENAEAVVNIGYEVYDKQIKLLLDASPGITVALSGSDWIIRPDPSKLSLDDLKSAVSKQGASVFEADPSKLVDVDDTKWLPKSFLESQVLAFKGEEKPISLVVPVDLKFDSSFLKSRQAILIVLDKKGDLIGTGSYSLLEPVF
jgi:hypothetical protein